MFRLKLWGDKRAARNLSRMAKGLDRTIEGATKKGVLVVQENTPSYPPQPATSDYRRTGTAGRSLTTYGVKSVGAGAQSLSRVEPFSGGAKGFVGGRLEYLPYLVDEDRQTDTHKRNGWYTLQQVLRNSMDAVYRVYRKAIGKLING